MNPIHSVEVSVDGQVVTVSREDAERVYQPTAASKRRVTAALVHRPKAYINYGGVAFTREEIDGMPWGGVLPGAYDTDADLVRLTAELASARQALDEAAAVIDALLDTVVALTDVNAYEALSQSDKDRLFYNAQPNITAALEWAKAHENAARGTAQAPGVENGVAGQETRGKGD